MRSAAGELRRVKAMHQIVRIRLDPVSSKRSSEARYPGPSLLRAAGSRVMPDALIESAAFIAENVAPSAYAQRTSDSHSFHRRSIQSRQYRSFPVGPRSRRLAQSPHQWSCRTDRRELTHEILGLVSGAPLNPAHTRSNETLAGLSPPARTRVHRHPPTAIMELVPTFGGRRHDCKGRPGRYRGSAPSRLRSRRLWWTAHHRSQGKVASRYVRHAHSVLSLA